MVMTRSKTRAAEKMRAKSSSKEKTELHQQSIVNVYYTDKFGKRCGIGYVIVDENKWK